MNNLDSCIELVTLAAAQYADDSIIVNDLTLVEALADGIFDAQIKELMKYNNLTIVDTLCSIVGDPHVVTRKHDIISDIITYSKWELLGNILYRQPYKNAIKNTLHNLTKYNDVRKYIESPVRFGAVYEDFVKWFMLYSVGSYTQDTYTGYVKKAFENYYYVNFKRDIWATLREQDVAKKESDMKQSLSIQDVKVVETGDIYINTLLTNIYVANRLLFKHSGHTLNTIVYDIFYLILDYRISKYVSKLNNMLTTCTIMVKDTGLPFSYNDNGEIVFANLPKGALSKISNARNLIPELYEFVADRKLNELFIGDLRENTFTLGKNATSDSNCVWRLNNDTKVTQSYIDQGQSIFNYDSFEKIIKGVVSVFTLMEAFEERGMSIVDIYDQDFFKDIDLIRSLDYMSSLKHKKLIRDLQNEPKPHNDERILEDFDQMVYSRAGSDQNNRIENKERRDSAYTYGLLKKPALKQSRVKEPFEKLRSMYAQISALPLSLECYQNSLRKLGAGVIPSKVQLDAIGNPAMTNDINYNYFLGKKPLLSARYLAEYKKETYICKVGLPNPTDGNVDVTLLSTDGLMLQMNKDTSLFQLSEEDFISLSELQNIILSEPNCGMTLAYDFTYDEIDLFPIYLDLHSSIETKHLQRLESLYSANKDTSFACRKYNDRLLTLSQVQASFVDLLYYVFEIIQQQFEAGNKKYANDLYMQFKRKEFVNDVFDDNLQFILETLYSVDMNELYASNIMYIPNASIFAKLIMLACVDRSNWSSNAIELINCRSSNADEKNLFLEFVNLVDMDISPTTVFVLFYNFLYTQLNVHLCLRDSFEMLFLIRTIEIKSFICEILTRFDVLNWQNDLIDNLSYGYAIKNVFSREILAFMRETAKLLFNRYSYILSEYTTYSKSCTNVFEDIYKYSTYCTPTSRDEFKSFGELFSKTRPKTDDKSLDALREICIKDDYGFFMRNGEYLKSHHNGSSYYVHKTGNLLKCSMDTLEPIRYSSYILNGYESEYNQILFNCLSNIKVKEEE